MHTIRHAVVPLTVAILIGVPSMAADKPTQYLSHPAVRTAPPAPNRPMGKGPAFYVDPVKGADTNKGTNRSPWKTIAHALPQLSSGDTLYLRGGTYFENVYCAVAGTKAKPITIRSFPGEQAVIDGGIPEFQTDPGDAWAPAPGGEGEYVSTGVYKNIRDVVGLFDDSNVGLQTYWHAMDLRAKNELWIKDEKLMVKPVYCGPGLWYDKLTGRIHCRLAHTHIDNARVPNYRGETDPRKLPLVVAPFNSTPLFVDQGMNVRFQDLIIRGGGYNSVFLQFGVNLEFDNVTIFCGAYGLRSIGTGPLKFTHSACYGIIPPWGFRTENALRTYTPSYYDPFLREFADPIPPRRNIARLPTHAILVTEGSFEFEVFYYPHNHDWDISYSEFTEGHDGVYLSGDNIRFHHNLVDNIQDDAIYLSAPTPYINRSVHVYQNLITRSLMAFGYHSRGGPTGQIFVYRNIADLRHGVNASRPTPETPQGELKNYHIHLMHGRGFLGVESIYYYQNTFISPAHTDAYAHRMLYNVSESAERRVFNNVCVYLNTYRNLRTRSLQGKNVVTDGNLHWCAAPKATLPKGFLEKARECATSQKNREHYPPGWAASSLVAEPGFRVFSSDPDVANDYRLAKASPAIGAGVVLPDDLEDPLRPKNAARPDIGAIPLGGKMWAFGRQGRIRLPVDGAGRPRAAARGGR